jgi:hypothetical protein
MTLLRTDDPLTIAVVTAIRGGDVLALKRLLDDNPLGKLRRRLPNS